MTRHAAAAALALALWPAVLQAQLGEVHLGALVSYGTADSYRLGGGLIGGISVGRLVYVGARYVYYAGGTQGQSGTLGSYDVTTRAQILAADVGLQYPAGALEIVAGLTIGATHYAQRGTPHTTVSPSQDSTGEGTEFLIGPNLSVQIRTLGLLLIPEVMYPLSGSPQTLPWPADHRGMVFAIRLVVPLEVARIRR